eukprot:m.134286 g.134286  ORF g.134286 m.134286 type:complete len:120 (+) comp15973_c0_seq7:1880-2239(+)
MSFFTFFALKHAWRVSDRSQTLKSASYYASTGRPFAHLPTPFNAYVATNGYLVADRVPMHGVDGHMCFEFKLFFKVLVVNHYLAVGKRHDGFIAIVFNSNYVNETCDQFLSDGIILIKV